ncbi:hypothetical protein Ct9H90mP29_12520 [bacterium]|nr:MAG: hypothetical protein Ct9H90mP29_12520 [bacterium]
MDFYTTLDSAISALAGAYGAPLGYILSAVVYFLRLQSFTPILYFKHGIDILLGKFDSDDDPGQITHFEALSSALLELSVWVILQVLQLHTYWWSWSSVLDVDHSILGMSTKFFTCTLALM